jgi:ABC-type protease/lipase transport system fused ATPase/permease subunit
MRLHRKGEARDELAQALHTCACAFRTVGVFSAIINLMLLVPSLYMLQVYDRVLASQNVTTLLMLTLMTLGALLLTSALEFVRSFILIRVGAKLDMKLNKRIYTAAFEQNLKKAGGNAGQALQVLASVRQFVTGNGLFAFFLTPRGFPSIWLLFFCSMVGWARSRWGESLSCLFWLLRTKWSPESPWQKPARWR